MIYFEGKEDMISPRLKGFIVPKSNAELGGSVPTRAASTFADCSSSCFLCSAKKFRTSAIFTLLSDMFVIPSPRTADQLTSVNTEPQWASLMYHDLLLSIFITPNDLVTCSVSLSSGPAVSSSMSSSLESPVEPALLCPEMAAKAAAGPSAWLPLVIKDKTNPSRRSIRFCMSSGVVGAVCWVGFFLREFV